MALDALSVIGSAVAGYLGSVLAGTAGTVSVFQDLATQGAAPPYVVFALQSAPDVYTWDGEEVQASYQVKAVSNRQHAGEATRLYGQVHGLLQDARLTMPAGVDLLRCRRTATVKYQDPKLFWHVGGIYRIDVIR